MTHLSTARSCQWYRKGKNPVPSPATPDVVTLESLERGGGQDDTEYMDMDVDLDMDNWRDVLESRDLFRFVLSILVSVRE